MSNKKNLTIIIRELNLHTQQKSKFLNRKKLNTLCFNHFWQPDWDLESMGEPLNRPRTSEDLDYTIKASEKM